MELIKRQNAGGPLTGADYDHNLDEIEAAIAEKVSSGNFSDVAISGQYSDLKGAPSIPAKPSDIGAASADQGRRADSAVQPGDLATVATTGAYADLSGRPPLGGAAALGAGTGPNDLVQLDGSGRLPAVDASQLVNIPSASGDLGELNDVVIAAPQAEQVLKYSGGVWVNGAAPGGGSGTVTSVGIAVPAGMAVSGSPVTTDGSITLSYDAGYEGFLSADKAKLDSVEAGADVTDTANVTAAGALMDSEVTNLAQIKAFSSADYATAAQGALADSAVQPGDDADALSSGAAIDGQVLTADGVGGAAWETPASGVTDHGLLSGLANDDHTIYALADGSRGAFASTAQGGLADSAVQPGDLATVATTGAYADLSGRPTLGTAAAAATEDFASAAQGALADSAQQPPAEGAFVNGDKTKLDGIEAGADVTDTANVTAAGALMDSEVTNLAQVKAFSSADYATAAQGALADSATQPGDLPTFPSGAVVGTTDTQTLSNKTLLDCLEAVYTITDGASVDIDPTNGSIQNWTLGANRTPTESLASGQIVLLRIADGTAYSITWPTTTWVGGSAPTLATSGWTLVLLWKDGSTLYGKHVGDVA